MLFFALSKKCGEKLEDIQNKQEEKCRETAKAPFTSLFAMSKILEFGDVEMQWIEGTIAVSPEARFFAEEDRELSFSNHVGE